MATGKRSSFYRFEEVAEAVEASGLPAQVLLAQRLGMLPWDWDPGSREGPRRLRQEELLAPGSVGPVGSGVVVRGLPPRGGPANRVRERKRAEREAAEVDERPVRVTGRGTNPAVPLVTLMEPPWPEDED